MTARTTLRARNLRNLPTDAERLLWQHLRLGQIEGVKFRRQYPIGPYFADFVALSAHLVVEVDGGQHAEQLAYDQQRDTFMQAQGFVVVRYWDNEVLQQTQAVLADIWRRVRTRLDEVATKP